VSAMGVLISLVAIPLRENVPIFSELSPRNARENWLEFGIDPNPLKPRSN